MADPATPVSPSPPPYHRAKHSSEGQAASPLFSEVSEFTTEALYNACRDVFGDLFRFMQVSLAQKQILDLNGQVAMLRTVSGDLLSEAASPNRSSSLGLSSANRFHCDRLWHSVNVVGDQCRNDTLDALHNRLNGMLVRCAGPHEYGIKLRLPEHQLEWYDNIFKALKDQAETLEVLLAAIRLVQHSNSIDADGNLTRDAREHVSILHSLSSVLRQRLHDTSRSTAGGHKDGIPVLRQALDVADSLAQTLPAVSMNRHFLVPNSTHSNYTGRRQQLQLVQDAFDAPYSNIQKRLIIQGSPGSGKTELAIKYAEEHRSAYWGVFWVDASSRSNATQSYAAIAIIAGEVASEASAKSWLSGRNYPWLLIIDNADDDQMQLDELFPSGPLGCVLVTTRNPAHNNFGTAGIKSFELGEMEQNEATELLLRAATEPQPWTLSATELAVSITKVLHYLPLALVYAGKAITEGLCKLGNYISHFNSAASRIRRERKRSRGRGASSEAYTSIYGSYEILFQSLEGNAARDKSYQDALELLQMFSYIHFNNIRLDMLVHSTVGPLQEAKAVAKRQQEEDILVRNMHLKLPRQSWSDLIRDKMRDVLRSKFFATPPVIPDVLKNHDHLDDDSDLEEQIYFRLRPALRVLVSRSLVMKIGLSRDTYNEGETDRYYMHPLVHKWIRERQDLSLGKQAVLCQMATTVVARAVRLVGGESENAKTMRREMKPHIDHVRQCAVVIRNEIDENYRHHKGTWLIVSTDTRPKPTFGPLQAEESARFGKVYLESGAYSEAAALLRRVIEYLVTRLGEHHGLTNLAKIGLAGALWHLTQFNDVTNLLDQVYESRKLTLGVEHPRTLDVTTELGRSSLGQGFMTKSRLLQEAALEGFTKAYGPMDRKTLMCKNDLGRVHWQLFNLDEALRYHTEALQGLEQQSSHDSSLKEDVLFCHEGLAMTFMRIGGADTEKAVDMMRHAVQRRIALQGKEHPLTLLAKAMLGQALGASKQFEEAEVLFRETLEIAVRNYRPDHLVILAAKSWYAQILMGLGQLDRALEYHLEATDKAKYVQAAAKDGEHPERIIHVWRLVKCLQRQGKIQEALDLCRDLQESVKKVGGHGLGTKHKFMISLKEKTELLQERLVQEGSDNTPAAEQLESPSQPTSEPV